jgi:predicted transcriptional regulator
MRRFAACLGTVAAILGALEQGPMRWTPLTRMVVQSSTPWRVQAVLEWLLEEGYLDRPTRGLYGITERGGLLLAALRAPLRRRREASIP